MERSSGSGIPHFTAGDFRTSTLCDLALPSPQCVMVAHKDGVVAVRSSKEASELRFSEAEWDAFVKGVKNGEFDFGPK